MTLVTKHPLRALLAAALVLGTVVIPATAQADTKSDREEVQRKQSEELARIDTLQNALSAAQLARDAALVDLDNIRQVSGTRRAELVSQLDPDLVALYEKVRAGGGAGAGLLQGRRCGACRIEIDRGEIARITAGRD